MFNKDDYMTVEEIASDWGMNVETIRRWIRKGYADRKMVEVHGGKYWVHKEEVHRWRAAYEGTYPIKGRRVPFAPVRRLLNTVS